MRRLNFKKNLILVSLLLWGVIKAQETKPFKLSEMSEAERNNKIEEIAFQAIRDNIERIKNDVYYDNPENLPRIDLGPGENYLRWENIEKQIIKSDELEIYREYYSRFIKDKTLNIGDIVYIANYTTNKHFVSPFVYSIVILDNGKPVEIRFNESRYSKIIYKNLT